jgi:hypothetical protein
MIRTLVGHEKPIISIKAVGKDVYSSSSDGQICVRPPSHALVPFHNAIQACGILTENPSLLRLPFCLLAYFSAGTRRSTARPPSSRTARRRSARPPARRRTRAGSSTRAGATDACTRGASRTSGLTVAVRGGVDARRRRVSLPFPPSLTLSEPPLIADPISFASELASQTSSCTCSPSWSRSRLSRRTTTVKTAARRPSTSRTRSSSSGPTRRSFRELRARTRWCWLRLGRSRRRRSARGCCSTVRRFLWLLLSSFAPSFQHVGTQGN